MSVPPRTRVLRRLAGAVLAFAIPAVPARASGIGEKTGPQLVFRTKAEAALEAAWAALGSLEHAGFVAGMESDRMLLAELRKDLPETRAEAEVYLARLKALAGLSDPVRLVPRADRLLEQAPLFYTWLEKSFKTEAERITEYYVGGASGFQTAFELFQNAVLFTVINRLDVASRALRAIDSERSGGQ